MKESTVKLSGHSKDQFLERFFAAEPDLDAPARQRLVARSKAAFTSLRVRKTTLMGLRAAPANRPIAAKTQAKLAMSMPSAPLAGHPKASPEGARDAVPDAAPQPAPALGTTPPAPALSPALSPASSPASAPADAAFDAYAIGLVPVFQREGRDGLLAKLAAITSIDYLRQMAKAQQIVLPQPLRLGDATPEAIRDGIADSVAKRIADRKAAAG